MITQNLPMLIIVKLLIISDKERVLLEEREENCLQMRCALVILWNYDQNTLEKN
jgi:hypothetical protein